MFLNCLLYCSDANYEVYNFHHIYIKSNLFYSSIRFNSNPSIPTQKGWNIHSILSEFYHLLINHPSNIPTTSLAFPLQYRGIFSLLYRVLHNCRYTTIATKYVFHEHFSDIFRDREPFFCYVHYDRSFRVSSVTTSTCVECGNISTGWISCV